MKKTTAWVGALLMASALVIGACGGKSKKADTMPDNKGGMTGGGDNGGAYGGGDMGGGYGGGGDMGNPCGGGGNPCGG